MVCLSSNWGHRFCLHIQRHSFGHKGYENIKGDIRGVPTTNVTQKVWLASQAIGGIAFAYTYNVILLDIEVYSQPLFAIAERWIAKKLPNSGFVNNTYAIKLPLLPIVELNLLRLCFRTAYDASTTGLAILLPYFNQVLGVLGA